MRSKVVKKTKYIHEDDVVSTTKKPKMYFKKQFLLSRDCFKVKLFVFMQEKI